MSSLKKIAPRRSFRAAAVVWAALAVAALAVAASFSACSGTGGPPAGGAWDDPRNSADLEILALIAREEFGRVLEVADSLAAAGIGDARLAGQKAMALGMLGREDEATALFEKTLLDDYESCENHLNFAVMLMKTGKTGRALTEFSEAGRFCDESRQTLIYRNLAVANLKMGREGEALGRVEDGLFLDPGDPYLLGLKGMLVASTNPAQAESLFVRSARRGAMSDDFLYQLGILFLKTGRPSAALMPLETISSRRPGDIEASLNYSEALIGAGRHEEAEERLRSLMAAGGGRRGRPRSSRGSYSGRGGSRRRSSSTRGSRGPRKTSTGWRCAITAREDPRRRWPFSGGSCGKGPNGPSATSISPRYSQPSERSTRRGSTWKGLSSSSRTTPRRS